MKLVNDFRKQIDGVQTTKGYLDLRADMVSVASQSSAAPEHMQKSVQFTLGEDSSEDEEDIKKPTSELETIVPKTTKPQFLSSLP